MPTGYLGEEIINAILDIDKKEFMLVFIHMIKKFAYSLIVVLLIMVQHCRIRLPCKLNKYH